MKTKVQIIMADVSNLQIIALSSCAAWSQCSGTVFKTSMPSTVVHARDGVVCVPPNVCCDNCFIMG